MHSPRRRFVPVAILLAATLALAACGSSSKSPAAGGTTNGSSGDKVTLRLGYLPNVTHAPALVGLEDGSFEKALGSNVTLKTSHYNSGTDETTAILANALDAAFVGPNPAINAYQKTNGTLIRIVAGTASGGAFLVVKPSITSVADLKGKKLATPSLGNTQDVALRAFLKSKGLATDTEGGGDVSIVPQENSTTVTAFQTNSIDGAWVPEPYATKLKNEGGHVLVDEATLWPGGKFVTTNLMVTTKFLADHPDIVTNLVKALAGSIDLINKQPAQAEQLVSKRIGSDSGKELSVDLVKESFKSITFTLDPIVSSLHKDAEAAKSLGFIDSTDLSKIYSLDILNNLLTSRNEATITP
ncbi:MAG: sulfonate transport system substrate-binding protein [Actinomycetota bacterium]|nr:sulfonate transport system substrate-binding protein [Actinomycetota bacterium]